MTITTLKGVYSGGSCALVERGVMCGKPIKGKGYCSMHWARQKRHGSPFVVKNNSGGTMMERFTRTTERRDDGCLEFTGHISKQYGYGVFPTVGTSIAQAHRWIWEQLRGPIPEGMTIDHLCHNEAAGRGECSGLGKDCPHRRCVDVEHMAVKSIIDNLLASPNHNKHKTHCKHGHEFTPENTYNIRTGGRACRACHRLAESERQRRLRQSTKGHENE